MSALMPDRAEEIIRKNLECLHSANEWVAACPECVTDALRTYGEERERLGEEGALASIADTLHAARRNVAIHPDVEPPYEGIQTGIWSLSSAAIRARGEKA